MGTEPQVKVSENAPQETKRLWQLHSLTSSDRFPDPKLDSLSALVEYAAMTYCDQPAFYFPSTGEIDTKYESIDWKQFHRVTTVLAAKYGESMHNVLVEANKNKIQPTVALLGHGKTIQYFATQIALQKLNVEVLLLAENNSPEAMQSLLERCKASVLMVEENFNVPFPVYDLLLLKMVHDCLNFTDVFADDTTFPRFEDDGDPWERPTFVIHSSGSTGPQKPIVHTNRSILTIARMYRVFPNFHIENWFLLLPL